MSIDFHFFCLFVWVCKCARYFILAFNHGHQRDNNKKVCEKLLISIVIYIHTHTHTLYHSHAFTSTFYKLFVIFFLLDSSSHDLINLDVICVCVWGSKKRLRIFFKDICIFMGLQTHEFDLRIKMLMFILNPQSIEYILIWRLIFDSIVVSLIF